MQTKNKSLLVLGLLSLIWGSYFLLIQIADDSFPPLFISTARLLLGSLVIYPVLRFRKVSLPPLGKVWLPFLLIGIFEALLPAFLIAFGEKSVPQALASILFSTMPIFTVIIGILWLHRPVGRVKAIAVLIGFLGVIVVLLPQLSASNESAAFIGVLAILAAAAGKAFAALYSKQVLEGKEPLQVVAGMMISTAVFSIPITLFVEDIREISPTPESTIALLLIGVFGAGVAFILFFWLIKNRGPTYASLVRFSEPPVALILVVLTGSATLQPLVFAGLILILTCLALMNGYLDNWLKKLDNYLKINLHL